MPKQFYTERDIKDLADRGVTALDVNDDVVITDLGRDMALKLGVKLTRAAAAAPADPARAELVHRVKAAVMARLDGQVEAGLLDAVVGKVMAGLNK
jgi:hypothetical protein